MNNHKEEQLLKQMIEILAQESGETVSVEGKTPEELKAEWRGLVNVRQPKDYGDLCELKVDAIVNAANSEMLGCFIPNHRCIDNAIHTFSGIELRSFCHHLMDEQGKKEPVGKAKITPAFNLPSKYIIHTVGPFLPPGQKVTPLREQLLAGCYKSCLEAAREVGLTSIAFCGISTGEFGFPKEPASRIAVDTVKKWLTETASTMTVVFSTYTKEDQSIYQNYLSGEQ